MSKADRFIYGDVLMTHALVFTGFVDDENFPKFRVEASWEETRGEENEYVFLTADQFRERVYEIVVDKKYVASRVLEVFKSASITLPDWDPMGKL